MPNLVVNNRAHWRGANEESLGYEQRMWRKRIVAISAFIDAADKSVMDLGAGSMLLRRLVPDGVTYIPVDYRKNAEDTVVCDFNQKEFPDRQVDVIVAAGILGYIEDPAWFLDEITSHCRKLILSYQGKEKFSYSPLYTKEIIDYLREKNFVLTGCDNSFPDNWTLIGCFEKMTADKLRKNISCTGCGSCVNVCPVSALSLKVDENGFLKPVCDSEKCINCNRCVEVCPSVRNKENINIEEPVTYAAWAKADYRYISSSGGIFSALAKYVLDEEGVIFGAAWDTDFKCHHIGIESERDLEKLRYSKYVQSDTENTFREARKYLEEGRKVLYSGCPCQIAGLKAYLGETYKNENLITVDLICFCIPSNEIFRKYLDENYGIENVSMVTFREKSGGWSPVGYRIDLKDGQIIHPVSNEDSYQQAFHNVLARNEVCENCQYTEFPRQGDITLGDFWGIERFDASWNDGMGTSLVYANSDKGERLIGELRDKGHFERIENVPFEWSRNNGNRIGNDGRKGNTQSRYFNELLKRKSFNEAVDKALNKKFDIGLAIVFNRNIGNNLTNFALYKILEQYEADILVIDAPANSQIKMPYKNVHQLDLFLRNWLPDYRFYSNYEETDYSELNSKCTQFVLGSDQLWRREFTDATDYYTCLDWVDGAKYKTAYGTSIGLDHYEGERPDLFGFLVSRFNAIGVREESGSKYLNERFNLNTRRVLDPVFLCPVEEYEKMAAIGRLRNPEEKYVAAYCLDMTYSLSEAIKYAAEQITDGTYNVILDTELHFDGNNDFDIKCLSEPAIEEWIASIHDCDFFITDSFHGMCFAIIFNKPFAVIFDKDNWRGYSRIADLLQNLELGDRLIPAYDRDRLDSLIHTEINYEKINRMLKEETQESRSWLYDNLSVGANYQGKADALDMARYIAGKMLKTQTDKTESKVLKEVTVSRNQFYLNKLENISWNEITMSKDWRQESVTVVAYGAGVCFYRNIRAIKEVYDLKYVCDKDTDKWGKIFEGVKCISPKTLTEMTDAAVVIMIDNPGVCMQVANDLSNMGIKRIDHVVNWLETLRGR